VFPNGRCWGDCREMSVSRNLQPVENVYARAQIKKSREIMYQIHLNKEKKNKLEKNKKTFSRIKKIKKFSKKIIFL
jgi:hypothetical protein